MLFGVFQSCSIISRKAASVLPDELAASARRSAATLFLISRNVTDVIGFFAGEFLHWKFSGKITITTRSPV